MRERAESVNKHAQQLREENQNLRAIANRLKDVINTEEFKEGHAKLKATPATDARAAYKVVYGQIPFSDEEWSNWTSEM